MNSFPVFLENKLITEYGENTYNQIINGYSKKRKVSIRDNTLKTNINKHFKYKGD